MKQHIPTGLLHFARWLKKNERILAPNILGWLDLRETIRVYWRYLLDVEQSTC